MAYNRTYDIANDIADRLEDDDLINPHANENMSESRELIIKHITNVLKDLIIINHVDVVEND